MDSPHLCLPSHFTSHHVLSVFIESAFAHISLSLLYLCLLLKADTQAHVHKDNSQPGTCGTGKKAALLCAGPLELTAMASLLKCSTFIMSWRLESALYLILTRLPFSPWVVYHIHCSLADWQDYRHNSISGNSQLITTPTLVEVCILPLCCCLEPHVYGACSLQSHFKTSAADQQPVNKPVDVNHVWWSFKGWDFSQNTSNAG